MEAEAGESLSSLPGSTRGPPSAAPTAAVFQQLDQRWESRVRRPSSAQSDGSIGSWGGSQGKWLSSRPFSSLSTTLSDARATENGP
jgi:hypothetical protein